jgi:hypothetical protein
MSPLQPAALARAAISVDAVVGDCRGKALDALYAQIRAGNVPPGLRFHRQMADLKCDWPATPQTMNG